jgi:shikimate kinase
MRKIILIGMKSSGKTTIGKILARKLNLPFTDMDAEIERRHAEQKGETLRFREIFTKYGGEYFRALETAALRALAAEGGKPGAEVRSLELVLATGGGLPLAEENRALLKRMGIIVFLDVAEDVLLARITSRGIPAFFPYPDDPAKSLAELLAARRPIYRALAHITVECYGEPPVTLADIVINRIFHGPNQ